MRIAVFTGSHDGPPSHRAAAAAFATGLAKAGVGIVYGGGRVGLMGVVADAALAAGGEVVGVIPQHLVDDEVAHPGLPRLEVVGSMHERKAVMADLADAFVALPGAAGTLEELFEAWTWGMLGLHAKPTALIDVDGFWQPLLAQLRRMVDDGYLDAVRLEALGVVPTADELLAFVENYRAPRPQVAARRTIRPAPDRRTFRAESPGLLLVGNPRATAPWSTEPMSAPLTRESLVVHGHRRAYVRAGSGPALLLLHGIGNNCQTWAEVIGRLAESHTVIAPDLLGHGDSDKPRGDYSIAAYANGMRDLLSVLDIEKATVVGHSLGGGIALQFAYQFPERCERLALVGSGGLGPEMSAGLRAATLPGAELVLGALTGISGPLRLGFSALDRRRAGRRTCSGCATWPRPATRCSRSRTSRPAAPSSARCAAWPTRRGQAVTALDRLYLANAVPMLVIWGSRDPIVPGPARRDGAQAGADRPRRGVRGRRPLAAPRRPRPLLRRAAGLRRDHRAGAARPRQLAAAARAGPAGRRPGGARRPSVPPWSTGTSSSSGVAPPAPPAPRPPAGPIRPPGCSCSTGPTSPGTRSAVTASHPRRSTCSPDWASTRPRSPPATPPSRGCGCAPPAARRSSGRCTGRRPSSPGPCSTSGCSPRR